jgi:PPOX class probable F420-dependent enzyme
MTDEQEEYLRSHKWAALATGRKDGSPQLSQIVYDWNGKDFAISVKSYTAKWNNALRQPKVSLLIHEERRQLVVYGTAECIDNDPERAEMTLRIHQAFFDGEDIKIDDNFIDVLNRDQRTILRVTPDKILDEGFEIVEE